MAAALAINYLLLAPYVGMTHEDFDAVHLYLPLAAGLAKSGLAFFANEQSIQAPPFAYVYPWLLGMDLHVIKVANVALSGVTLLCTFRSAQLAHSTAAGVFCAGLFALCPLTRPWIAAPMTEAPYLLLGAIWMWGFAEFLYRGKRYALAIAAVAISLAILTRATMFFGVVLIFGATALYAIFKKEPHVRRTAWMLALAHGCALLPALAFSLKNYLVFGFPFFATGGGNALYLGLNPLTGGYDANYLGIEYDVGAIALGHHLTLKAEYLFRGVAKMIVAETPPWTLAANLARKLVAFLFVTNAEHDVIPLRLWRVGLLTFAAWGIWCIKHPAMKFALAGMIAYQVAVHVPVLYTHRYSVGAIDLWLILAAGIGLASFRFRTSWPLLAILGAGSLLAVGAYHWYGRPMPNVFASGRILIWQGQQAPFTLSSANPLVEVPVSHSKWFGWLLNTVLVVDMPDDAAGKRCSELKVSFKPEKRSDFSAPVVRRPGSEKPRSQYQLGATKMALDSAGTLRFEAACAADERISIDRLRVYGALGAVDYRERLLGQPPQFPVER